MLIDPPVPTPSPAAGDLAAIAPASVRVDVENGSAVSGMAKRVADLLRRHGFVIGTVGNADGSVSTTELHEHTRIEYAGLKVREALGKAASNFPVIADVQTSATAAPSAQTSDVTVIVGSDLASILQQQASTQP